MATQINPYGSIDLDDSVSQYAITQVNNKKIDFVSIFDKLNK